MTTMLYTHPGFTAGTLPATPRVEIPVRDCLRFITSSGSKLYLTIPTGVEIPQGLTYQEAMAFAKDGVPSFEFHPRNWIIRESYREPRPRCVELTHPRYGVCYVALRADAPIPTTPAELRAGAVRIPGSFLPQGQVVARLTEEAQ